MNNLDFQPVFDYIDKNNKILVNLIATGIRTELQDIKKNIESIPSNLKRHL